MAVVRVRQHVNPLSHKYSQPVSPPRWDTIYANPALPLHLDLGCGKGYFLRDMALAHPDWNFLGLEIRQPLVEAALKRRDVDQVPNLHFIFCNANTVLGTLLSSWGEGLALQRVSIQFPDPWFKKRHHKRRIVQPELVQTLAQFLPRGGEVFLQSDVQAVAHAMADNFGESPCFDRELPDWLNDSPFSVQTDRERVTLAQEKPVYRTRFVRNQNPCESC